MSYKTEERGGLIRNTREDMLRLHEMAQRLRDDGARAVHITGGEIEGLSRLFSSASCFCGGRYKGFHQVQRMGLIEPGGQFDVYKSGRYVIKVQYMVNDEWPGKVIYKPEDRRLYFYL